MLTDTVSGGVEQRVGFAAFQSLGWLGLFGFHAAGLGGDFASGDLAVVGREFDSYGGASHGSGDLERGAGSGKGLQDGAGDAWLVAVAGWAVSEDAVLDAGHGVSAGVDAVSLVVPPGLVARPFAADCCRIHHRSPRHSAIRAAAAVAGSGLDAAADQFGRVGREVA